MEIDERINKTGFIATSKALIHLVGINPALIYAELLSKKRYFEERGTLIEGNYFFCSANDLENSTGLTRGQQNRAFEVLEKHNLLEKQTIHNSRYFAIEEGEELSQAIEKGKKIQAAKREEAKENISDFFKKKPQKEKITEPISFVEQVDFFNNDDIF